MSTPAPWALFGEWGRETATPVPHALQTMKWLQVPPKGTQIPEWLNALIGTKAKRRSNDSVAYFHIHTKRGWTVT